MERAMLLKDMSSGQPVPSPMGDYPKRRLEYTSALLTDSQDGWDTMHKPMCLIGCRFLWKQLITAFQAAPP